MVVCDLPKAGLGNQLFPLMRARLFQRLNRMPAAVIGAGQFKIGPYLRGEKIKRSYSGYFNFEQSLFQEWRIRKKLKKEKAFVQENPVIKKLDPAGENSNNIYLFNQIPAWTEYFVGLQEFRPLVKELFDEMLNPHIREKANNAASASIGAHIRMGDFRKLQSHEDFSRVGSVRTPLHYFVETVNKVREINGAAIPVSIFSDGKYKELKPILELKNTSLVEGNPDIVDMMLLSKSKLILTSAGSTFGYWAGFLSDAPIILHPDHLKTRIRSFTENEMYEGPLDVNDLRLLNLIRHIPLQ